MTTTRIAARVRADIAARPDEGFTLIELIVAMSAMTVVIASFVIMFFAFGSSGTGTQLLTVSQSRTRQILRVLESDLRSADPLLSVPASFTADPNGAGTSGNIVAMYESPDQLPPCSTTTTSTSSSTTTTLATPYQASTLTANVIWAFDPVAQTLTRYSYYSCGSTGWIADDFLYNVVNASGTLFSTQIVSGAAQVTTTTSATASTLANQAVPICATTVTANIVTKSKEQQTPFKVKVVVALPNEQAVEAQACA